MHGSLLVLCREAGECLADDRAEEDHEEEEAEPVVPDERAESPARVPPHGVTDLRPRGRQQHTAQRR